MGASTSVQIDVFSDGIIQAVKEGEISSIEVLVHLKAFEKASGRILKEIQEHFVREAEKHPGNEFTFHGNTIQKREVGVKYDYTVCADPEWEQFNAAVEQAVTRRQEREALLKALTKPTNIITDDGEGITIYPPKKSGTQSLIVTIK